MKRTSIVGSKFKIYIESVLQLQNGGSRHEVYIKCRQEVYINCKYTSCVHQVSRQG